MPLNVSSQKKMKWENTGLPLRHFSSLISMLLLPPKPFHLLHCSDNGTSLLKSQYHLLTLSIPDLPRLQILSVTDHHCLAVLIPPTLLVHDLNPSCSNTPSHLKIACCSNSSIPSPHYACPLRSPRYCRVAFSLSSFKPSKTTFSMK